MENINLSENACVCIYRNKTTLHLYCSMYSSDELLDTIDYTLSTFVIHCTKCISIISYEKHGESGLIIYIMSTSG